MRHSCCLIILQMILSSNGKAWTMCSAFTSEEPRSSVCVRELLSLLEELLLKLIDSSHWDQTSENKIMTLGAEVAAYSPTMLLFFHWSSEDDETENWHLGCVLLWCTIKYANLLIILYLSINIRINLQNSGKFHVAVYLGNCENEN